jgi:2'-5' RNA ligase
MRLFVALSLPEMVRNRLALLGGGVPGANWLPPENLHLTLRFIGEVSPPEARDIDGALARLGGEPLRIELAGVGQFGDRRNAKVLWVGVRPNPALTALRDRIESALVRAGLPPESRKYFPHVTLARLRNAPVERVGRFLESYGDFSLPGFTVDRFTLYSSLRGNQSSVYRPEAEYPLDYVATAAC